MAVAVDCESPCNHGLFLYREDGTMSPQLAKLIADYQASIATAVALLYRSGIDMPSSGMAWASMDIPARGTLDGGQAYFKHGAGCKVWLETGAVDFDFGRAGEIGGVDIWWLGQFAKDRLASYGFASSEALTEAFEAEVAKGALSGSPYGLFYLADVPRVYAQDIDCRSEGDELPARNLDRVLSLHSHYFQSADLMQSNYNKLDKKWDSDGELSQRSRIDMRIYLSTWIGYLAVCCEGWQQLGMRRLLKSERPESFHSLLPMADALGRMMNVHGSPLRKFRNDVFHLRQSPQHARQFLEQDARRLVWARDMHSAMAEFFSGYRIECEVHYARNDRKGEFQLRRKAKRRVLAKA